MKDNKKDKNKDPFDIKKFKKGISAVESSGGKYLWNKTSSATGKYQFLYNEIKNLPLMKGVTRKQFMENEQLQEKVMDMAIKGKLKGRAGYFRNARDLSDEYSKLLGKKWNYRPDEVAAISHFLGRQGARNYFKSLSEGNDYKVPGKVNLKVEEYLDKYNKSINSKQGYEISPNILDKPHPSRQIKNPELLQQKQDLTNPNQFSGGFANFSLEQPNVQKINKKPEQQPKPQMQSQANFLEDYIANNKFAYGGSKNKSMYNLYEEGGELTEFNNGGTHEENPLGGIPQGIGANGQPNLVEEGETKSEDYIFSDRLVLDLDAVNLFNLPNNLKGKTIAEASKKINEYSKESNNTIDKETTKENLERLKRANEFLKDLESAKGIDDNMFAEGGFMDFVGKAGGIAGAATGAIGLATQIGGALGDLFAGDNAYKKYGQESKLNAATVNSQFALGGSLDPDYPANPNDLISSFKTNKEALNYANPYPERSNRWNTFDAYQNKLKSSAFGQADTSPLATRTYKDVNGFKGQPLKDEVSYNKKMKNRPIPTASNKEYLKNIGDAVTNKFGKGGNLYFNGGPVKPIAGVLNPDLKMRGREILMGETPELKFDTSNIDSLDTRRRLPKANLDGFLASAERGLRYASPFMNAIQAATISKPEAEGLDRIGTRFKPDYADENQMVNLVDEQFSGMKDRLAGISGGGLGAMRTNMQAANLNQAKARSAAFQQADNINRQQNMAGQQFNLGIDKTNMAQSNLQKDINAKNRGAYDTNKSRLLSLLGNDVGAIGLEALRRKYPELMGLSYDTKGRYLNSKKD